MPDIRMQANPLPGPSPDQPSAEDQARLAFELERQQSKLFRTSSIESYCSGLEALNRPDITGEAKDKLREELRRRYGEAMSQAIGINEQIFDALVDRNHSAYPYYNSPGEGFFSAVKAQLSEAREADWMAENSEAWVWLKRLERDIEWAHASFRASVGFSASSPAYFDVILQLQTLKQQRECVLTEDLEAMYAQELPGLEISPLFSEPGVSEYQLAQTRKIGITVPDKYREQYKFPDKLTDGTAGYRELAIKLQDDRMAWQMRIAAASQFDYSKPYDEASFMGQGLKQEELYLIKLVLGEASVRNGIETSQVLNPFSADSNLGVQRRISSTIQALLQTNAFERTQQIANGGGSAETKMRQLDGLSTQVKELAKSIQRRRNVKEKNDPVARLSRLVTKMGYLQDYSLLTSSCYCWSYVWERNTNPGASAEEKKWRVKKLEIGGINGPSGDAWSLSWARRKHNYDQNNNASASELLPTSKTGRKDVKKLPLNEMPKYLDIYGENLNGHPDSYLVEKWKFLFSNENRYKAKRKELGYADIPHSVRRQLMKWAFIWKTPYNAKDLGGEEGDYEIEIPHFFPPSLPIANMWNTLTVEDDKKITHGGKSIWEQLIHGEKMSKIDWTKLDQKAVERWLVDCDMSSRWMKVLIEVIDISRDPTFAQIAEGTSTLGPKELAKRIRLALRDSPDSPPTVYEQAMIPWIVTLITANKYKISSAGGWLENPQDKIIGRLLVDHFKAEMALWKRSFKWLAADRPELDSSSADEDYDYKDLEYGNTMALLAEFYERLLIRMGKSSVENSIRQAQQNYNKSVEVSNREDDFLTTGKIKHKFPTDVTVS